MDSQTADNTPDRADDLAALKTRRDALRAFAESVAECVRALPLPETYLEAERATRAVTMADRIIEHLPSEDETPTQKIAPIRLRLRAFADEVMAAAIVIPKPDSFLEGERAARYALAADRMLTQLYEAPKTAETIVKTVIAAPRSALPKPAPKPKPFPKDPDYDDEDDAPEHDLAYWQNILEQKLDRLAKDQAQKSGIWQDGTPYDPADPDYGCGAGKDFDSA